MKSKKIMIACISFILIGIIIIGIIVVKEVSKKDIDLNSSNYFILYDGIEISQTLGVQSLSAMELTKENINKYNTTYYNYENGKEQGITQGKFENETYEGTAQVENVKKIATSKEYNIIPRKYENIMEIPEEIKKSLKYTSLEMQAIDLDGDGKKEYVVCYNLNYTSGETEDRQPVASSGIILLDSNYQKIADLITLEEGFWSGRKKENNKIFLKTSDVEYLDIDKDGIMEIVINIPQYEGTSISIVKYNNGKIDGETGIKASVLP